jgi:hypothetical protein
MRDTEWRVVLKSLYALHKLSTDGSMAQAINLKVIALQLTDYLFSCHFVFWYAVTFLCLCTAMIAEYNGAVEQTK